MRFLCLGLAILGCAQSATKWDPRLRGGRRNGAGIEVRLLKKGLDYINDVGGKVLNNAIPNMRIPEIRQPIAGGTVFIRDSKFLGFKPARRQDYHLKAPNKFRFDIRGLGAVIAGKFDADVKLAVPIKAKGKFKLTITSMDLQADLAISKGPGGQPKLSSPFCKARADIIVDLTDTGALLDLILNGLRGVINNQVKTGLETKLCGVIKKVIEVDANKLMENFPLQTNLDEALGNIGNLFGLKKGANMILRYGLTEDADMSPAFDHITLSLDGEVSKEGKGRIPFFPKAMLDPDTGRSPFPDYSSNMIYAHVSDHLLNSFLYALSDSGLFRVIISGKTFPNFANLLKTDCFSASLTSVCVGDLMSDLSTHYDGHDIALIFEPTESPTFFFREGKGVLNAQGTSRWMVRPEGASDNTTWKTVYWADLRFEGDVTLNIVGDKMVGGFAITRLDSTLKRQDPAFDLSLAESQAEIQDLSDLAKEFMAGGSSGLLGGGFPLPSIKGMRWKDPDVRLYDGYLRLKSLFELNKVLISEMVLKAIKKANFG